MVIPWIGFPLAKLLEKVEPMSQARYVSFQTLHDPERLPNQRTGGNGEDEIAAELLAGALPTGARLGGGKPFVTGCVPVLATCSGALPGNTTTRVPT